MYNSACLKNLTVALSQLSAVPFVKGCVSNICWELFPFYQLFFSQLPFFFLIDIFFLLRNVLSVWEEFQF